MSAPRTVQWRRRAFSAADASVGSIRYAFKFFAKIHDHHMTSLQRKPKELMNNMNEM